MPHIISGYDHWGPGGWFYMSGTTHGTLFILPMILKMSRSRKTECCDLAKGKMGCTIVCNGRSARFQRLCEHLVNVETHDGDQICVGEMVFYNCKTFHGGYKSPICGWNRVSRAFRGNILSFLLIGDTSVKQSEVRSACSFCVSPLHRASRAFIRHHTIDTEAFICCLCP